jgi:catechol 2,3-dioxygenase-like lactoylglutathione lyase family enzyme
MSTLRLEHVNVTVRDPARTAELLQQMFGWRIRWQGPGRDGGHTIHVGTDDYYLALYVQPGVAYTDEDFAKGRPLNHIGVEVEDIGEAEAKVRAAGLTPFNHADYDPGRRFYFLDPDGIEYEVVSYR